MKTKCQGIFGLGFGHKFKDVYDERRKPPENIPRLDGTAGECVMLIKALTEVRKTYIKSVCNRCGETIHRRDGKDGLQK